MIFLLDNYIKVVNKMNFNRNDENYIYEVIGRNVKKYRKKKGLTQRQLANRVNYSLSFVAGLESKKHQTFSLGALYRISLIGLKDDIPYDLINTVSSINKLYTNQVIYPNFKYLFSKNIIICYINV